MRRSIRPLCLLMCSAIASTASATPPGRSAHQQTQDRACPVEQPEQQHLMVRSHRVARGDSLSSIAYRYGTTVRALAAANGMSPGDRVRVEQRLVIPGHSRPGGGDDWLKYARAPKEAGQLELFTYTQRFRGPVVVDGRVVPAARSQISALLGIKGSRPALPERLLRLLVRVSDTFGGRPVRVVSGYRTSSFYSDSRHKRSEAIDFSIPGVPNAVVRQYLLLLDDVGVGYYPNSSFLHLDVRSCPIQWTDYAGPGEAPRRAPRRSLPRARRLARAEAIDAQPVDSAAQHEEDHDAGHGDVEPDRQKDPVQAAVAREGAGEGEVK